MGIGIFQYGEQPAQDAIVLLLNRCPQGFFYSVVAGGMTAGLWRRINSCRAAGGCLIVVLNVSASVFFPLQKFLCLCQAALAGTFEGEIQKVLV